MKLFQCLTLVICLIAIVASTRAQENAGNRMIVVDDLPNIIDQAKADLFFDELEAKIEKLVKDNVQLSSWSTINPGRKWSDAGRVRTSDSLIYGHGLIESGSPIYLDRFGENSLYIRLKIETQRSFARISGSGAGSVAHGWSVAGGCLIAQITSANPRNANLEKQLTNIIESGVSRHSCE